MNNLRKIAFTCISVVFICLISDQMCLEIDDRHLQIIINDIFDTSNNGTNLTDQVELNKSLKKVNPCERGICTPSYLCDEQNNILTDGQNVLNLRFGEQCDQFERCCNLNHNKTKEIDFPFTCGLRNDIHISNERKTSATQAEFPWTVAILHRNLSYHSGGSLIHPKVVLTTAHYLAGQNKYAFVIRAGEWDLSNTDEYFKHQDRQIEEIIVHPQFNRRNLNNDIALIVLNSPMDIAQNVNPVCLPKLGRNFNGQNCFATGWGVNAFNERNLRSILKRVELPFVSHAMCEQKLRTTRLGARFKLNKSFICAGGEEGVDTCCGDGGSPLVCPVPETTDQFYQAGIVSWGIGCNNAIPAAYVNVARFRNWIDGKMRRLRLSTTSYDPSISYRQSRTNF